MREEKDEAFCKVCKTVLRAHKADLIKHTHTKGHRQKYKALHPEENKQETLDSHIIIEITKEQKENDLRLAAYIAAHSAVRSIDHLNEVLKQLNIDGKTPLNKLKIHRTKCSALIKCVLGPSILENLKERLLNASFSLIIDESTDCSVFKFLSVYVKFFDVIKAKICTEFVSLISVESVTANDLFKVLNNFIIQELGLNLRNMIGIGTDGANSLCGKNHSVFTLFKQENPKIQLVRCICHSIDNAASKAVDEMPACVDYLCREVYNWFCHSTQRRIEYRRLFDILNGKEKVFHNFVQLSNTRWLARFNAVKVIVENWEELKVHFNTVVNKEKCYSARVLSEMLNTNSNYLSLLAVKPILFETNKLNLLFQKDDLDLGVAYQHVSNLVCLIAAKIFKPAFVEQKNINTYMENYDNTLAYVEPHQADFGIEYTRALQNFPIELNEKVMLETKCFNYIKKCLGELIKRLPDNLDLFKKISVLSPKWCLCQVTRRKFIDLPFLYLIPEKDLFEAENQYNLLPMINWDEFLKANPDFKDSTQHFWSAMYNFKNVGEEFAFRIISLYALKVLSLPSSNAVVERGFSIMNIVKTKIRNRMGVEMLNSILRVRLNLVTEDTCCKNFIITKDMFSRFKTSTMYNNRKDTITVNNDSGVEDETVIEMFDDTYDVPCISLPV